MIPTPETSTVIADSMGDRAETETFGNIGIIGLNAYSGGDGYAFLAYTPAQARALAADLTARADQIEASR